MSLTQPSMLFQRRDTRSQTWSIMTRESFSSVTGNRKVSLHHNQTAVWRGICRAAEAPISLAASDQERTHLVPDRTALLLSQGQPVLGRKGLRFVFDVIQRLIPPRPLPPLVGMILRLEELAAPVRLAGRSAVPPRRSRSSNRHTRTSSRVSSARGLWAAPTPSFPSCPTDLSGVVSARRAGGIASRRRSVRR